MPKNIIDDKISSSLAEGSFKNLFQENIKTDIFRKGVIEIFDERIGMVSFSNKVKKYAAEEMDKRIFTSFKYWFTVVITSIVASILGAFASKFIK